MHIKRVKVDNFRNEGIGIVWDLNPDVNILVGKNGCGKTTLLRNIENCLIQKDKNDYRIFKVARELNLSSGAIVEFLHKQGFAEVMEDLNARLNQAQYILLAKHFKPDKLRQISKKNVAENFPHNIYLDLTEDFYLFENAYKLRLHTFDVPVNEYLSHNEPIKIGKNSALDITLEKTSLQFILFQSELRKKLDNFYFGKIKLNAEERKNMEAELQTNHQRIEIFTAIVNDMFKDTEKIIDLDSFSFTLKNKTVIQLTDLSSGEKQVILILLTALLQNHQETVLLLDEPEISLDTYWQRELLRNIRTINPNCQLIVATHSPAIIGRGWTEHFKRWEEISQESTDNTEIIPTHQLKSGLDGMQNPEVVGKIDLESFRRKTPPKK